MASEETGRSKRTLSWGYAQHAKSTRDVTDEDRWQTEEQWAIDNALTYARLEQIPGLSALAPGPDFMEFFERMLDANLHVPLDVCTSSESEEVQETEQSTLVVADD